MSNTLKKYFKLLLKLAISIGALYFVYTKIDITRVGALLGSSQLLYLFMAILLFIISKAVAAFRLKIFLGSVGVVISNIFNFRLYLLGMFYNLFLPGGIGGDGYKIYLLNKRSNVRLRNIFWVVLIDRISGVSGLLSLAVILFYFLPIPGPYRYYIWALLPLAVGSFYIIVHFFFCYLRMFFFSTYALSLGVQLLQMCAAYFIIIGLGIQTQQLGYLFIFLVSSIVAAITPSIGGAGTREITFYFGSQFIQLNTDSSIALSILFYLITVLVSFTGIYYLLYPKKLAVN